MENDDDNDLFKYARQAGDDPPDRGVAKASEVLLPWMARAMRAARRRVPSDFVGTGEDVRIIIVKEIGPPHSPNAWGALINQLSRPGTGILIDTGKVRKMRAAPSHGRRTPIYRRG